jgi:hypothetical protein
MMIFDFNLKSKNLSALAHGLLFFVFRRTFSAEIIRDFVPVVAPQANFRCAFSASLINPFSAPLN